MRVCKLVYTSTFLLMPELLSAHRKIIELEEELKVVTNNMKSLEIAEQEVTNHRKKFPKYRAAYIILQTLVQSAKRKLLQMENGCSCRIIMKLTALNA